MLHEPSAHILDLSGFISKHGENNVFDHKQFFYGDLKISIQYIPSLAEEFMGYIKAIMGLNKKCIVLDLDNTLWGGIIGEDGFKFLDGQVKLVIAVGLQPLLVMMINIPRIPKEKGSIYQEC